LTTIAQIRADLVGSSAVFRSEMIAGQRQANDSLRQIQQQVQATATSIKTLNTAAAGFVGFEGIKNAVSDLIDAQKAVQQIHFSLLSAVGSNAGADTAYAQVADEAAKLGLDLKTAELGFSQMSAAASANGISMKQQQELFDGVSRSATVLHLTSEQTGSAVLALSQIFGKGKIQAQELQLQLGQAIPGVVPRFQQAVMQMTQGTNLAGKSFQQLLESGDLTVQRFLPALIQALNQTGRGADEASTGLNAEINRLSSAWFKLKADLSGGLFGDAAISSIRLVTTNLTNLSDLAGVAGGLIVSRLAGQGLGKAADAGSAYIDQAQQARAAAIAASELADAQAAEAASQIKATEAALEGVTAVRQQALAAREAALASADKAAAEDAAAQATLAHVRSAATLSANIRAEATATAQATVAQQNLTRAQTQYDAAVAASATLKDQQIALEARLVEARAAGAAAAEAQAVAERQLATSSAAGLLARGASSLGNFALGIVGGPWGAAVAAIAAVGYAIYDVQKQSEAWREETQKQVQSLQQLRDQVQAAAKDYGTLHAQMGISQTVDLFNSANAQIDKTKADIADLESQIEHAQARINARAGGPVGSSAAADWLDQSKIDSANEKIKALSEQLPATEQNVDSLGTKIAGSFAPSIDALTGAFNRLKAGANLGDLVSGWISDIDGGISGMEAARTKVQQIQSQMQADAQKLATEAATDGMNNVQKQQYALQQAIKNINAQHLSPDIAQSQIADVTNSAAAAIQAGAQKDAADAAKKAAQQAIEAAKQQKEAYDNVVNSIKDRIAQDTEAAASDDKLTTAEKLRVTVLNDIATGHLKLSATQKAYVTGLLNEAVAEGDAAKAAQEHQKQLEAMAVVQDNIARLQKQQADSNNDALSGLSRGSQYTQDAAGLRAIQRQYDDLASQAGKQLAEHKITPQTYDQEVADYKQALDQELAAQKAFYAERDAMQSDWTVGAQRALDNYQRQAQDVASQTEQAFNDAFSGLSDALVQFVQTGKLSFTSLANSIIADLARMEIKAATSGLFQLLGNFIGSYFGNSGVGTDSNVLGGDNYTGTGSLSTSFGSSDWSSMFGGGRATGGPTTAGTIYEVAEGGKPELYHVGARTYLLSGTDGYVQPAGQGGAGGASPAMSASPTMTSGADWTLNIYTSGGGDGSQKATAQQSQDSKGNPSLDVFFGMFEQRLAGNVAQGKGPLIKAFSGKFQLNPGVSA
jgi:lambda family phage tail tape measure protein